MFLSTIISLHDANILFICKVRCIVSYGWVKKSDMYRNKGGEINLIFSKRMTPSSISAYFEF